MPDLQCLKIKNYLRGPYTLGDLTIQAQVPVENKWFPNDLVRADGKVVERKVPPPIHGVLDLMSRTGQGFSPRGVPLYLFYPLDPTWPPFLVAYKERSAHNLLVTIQYEHWNCGRWPRGGILKTHIAIDGSPANIAIEQKLLCDTYGAGEPCIAHVTHSDVLFEGYESVKWDHAFNVDPSGTEDVDDIFAWRTVDETTYFMIAIADVSAWVQPGSEVDTCAYELGQTLYNDGVVMRPMLPHELSTKVASLRKDGDARPVLGLVFVIKNGVVQDVKWQKHSVILTDAHTYESVLMDNDLASTLHSYLEIVCSRALDSSDTHDWVAQAMILYNHKAAQILHSAGVGVLRRQDGMKNTEYVDIAATSGCAEIAMFGASAGKYCGGNESQTAHSGLGLDVYCHASSPLRRYADLVNQRMLKHLLFGEPIADISPLGELALHLNHRASAAKWLERELWFSKEIKPNAITESIGICLKVKDETAGQWQVYVPEWRRVIVGCGAGLKVGDHVTLRAYCDLRRPSWRDRIVCQLTLHM